MFGDLVEAILNNNNSNNNNNNNNNNNESNNKKESKNENVNENENENENKNENENENESENENENDDEQYEIKQINNSFKNIDETKSFEDQINIFKKLPWLNDYWYTEYYEDNKKTNLRLFKLEFAHIFNDVDDNLFKEIFGFTSVELADKLINTTSKAENQMLVNDIEINRDKIFEQYEFSKSVIEPAHKCDDLLDTVQTILKFNETTHPYLT